MPTFTRIDDDKFEITQPSTTQLSVVAIQAEIATLQADIDQRVALIQGAAAQGVGGAQPLLDLVRPASLSPKLTSTTPLAA